ncbi:hypothetical protein IJ21_18220 [Paenibacillus sp. 32O-W]|uniref:DUF2935 domain-containing protein n=1 Tax=Paenibacillus sp. 32O-W TaxID=1695218 RepID=UPI00071EFCBA|nr:DUF2935 domain-containing protein [Paenibacillus sp. 32O-W]ALS27223.1 hypothetical protein IJ21_18220 [Paenibacillus sp. 32O-W]
MNDALFEHRFWLQIMGDHARLILHALSPKEKNDAERAQAFIARFDGLLAEAGRPDAVYQLSQLNRKANETTEAFRAFKLDLLERLLTGKVVLGFTPTFLNHMVNELEEYLRILQELLAGKPVPKFHPLHHDVLWLQDAIGHAASLAGDFDLTEQAFIRRSMEFQRHFESFYLKAVEMAGFMRTRLKDFPAFHKFHRDVNLEMRVFMHFLKELEEMELGNEVLDRIVPLIPDHMYREECYYLTKLAESGAVPMPDCDPARPRVQS